MKNNRKVCVCSPRDRIVAVGCSSMCADILRGEYYCGNLLWQSSLTLLFHDPVVPTRRAPMGAVFAS